MKLFFRRKSAVQRKRVQEQALLSQRVLQQESNSADICSLRGVHVHVWRVQDTARA